MRVVRGWREGLEIDERAAKESEMIRMGVGAVSYTHLTLPTIYSV